MEPPNILMKRRELLPKHCERLAQLPTFQELQILLLLHPKHHFVSIGALGQRQPSRMLRI
jgi:hypothetical protein